MANFYTRAGALVQLSNNNRTASRNNPAQEFNNGVVLSAEPLKNNQLFEVQIDKKIPSWSGSIEIGVTTSDPRQLIFPTSATGFRDGTFVMSGSSILKDGHTSVEEYGQDLDQLGEGDRIGVLRTGSGALHFYVNGEDQGQAVQRIPETVWAVVDMYGKCAQVTIVDDVNRETILQNEFTNEMIQEAAFAASTDKLIFHDKTGTLIKLSNGRRTAERKRPLDEFNNGVVMTNRGIRDDEMFEIRIDRLVDKWSGSIEVGITAHNPGTLDFPATMTNMRSGKTGQGGTIMMSGCGILTNGKGTRREYGDFNLDELQEGDHIGLMRKSNGALHYYINGQDQGVAATHAPDPAWGVVDLYGMAVKVTIVDGSEVDVAGGRAGAVSNRSTDVMRQLHEYFEEEEPERGSEEVEKLLFHPHCGAHAAVIFGGKTAHRPNAVDDFNNGVVLTNRHLRPNEMFEVRLDKLVDKWAGSVEIGVTTHSPLELDFPSTMTNIRSGTWMMTGNGVMHNGSTVHDDYGQNLDRLKVGDRVAALRKEDGTLHFYVNGVDQGQGASNVPADVYGVVDLYGQAVQATIVAQEDRVNLRSIELEPAVTQSDSASGDILRFHPRHGRNSVISADGRTASRPNARGEFNDAIVMTSRPLKDNELFEVSLDKMVDRWSGSIEAGVTLIHPEDLDLPSTMTDIDYDTWMLSGSAVMQDGSTIRNGYKIDLDTLPLGSRVGMMRASDATLHFYLDGEDMGVACTGVPTSVYAVIDLYGQCAQVSITDSSRVIPENNVLCEIDPSLTSPISTAVQVTHRFSLCAGKNVHIKDVSMDSASRVQGFSHGLVFSMDPLSPDELFEIRVERMNWQWSGSLHIGLTTLAISDALPHSVLPPTALQLKSKATWVVTGSDVRKCGETIKDNYATSLQRLDVGDKVGVKYTNGGDMHVLVNGEDMGVAATGLPKGLFGLVDLFGMVEQVSITSTLMSPLTPSREDGSSPPSIHSLESMNTSTEDDHDEDTAEEISLEFHKNHGKNIELVNDNMTAIRTCSYNNGLVVSHKPLPRNHQFKVKIEKLTERWSSSIQLGVLDYNPEKLTLPPSASNLQKDCWLIQADTVFHARVKIKEGYGPNLDSLQPDTTLGILVDDDGALHLYVNDVDQGVAATDIPLKCHALVDIYGQCGQVSIVTSDAQQAGQSVEYCKEKANMEEGVKEKPQRSLDLGTVKNCEYERLCNRFKRSLGLPEGYFNTLYDRCFCDTCHKTRGDAMYYRKGEPPKDCALPAGWCRFGLRLPPKAECLNVFEKWHMAFHGAHISTIRRILDTGDLMPQGEEGIVTLQPQIFSRDEKNKPEDECSVKQLSLSPTIKYAACEQFAPSLEYRDPKTKKSYKAQVAFQVCVKPGSYKIAQELVDDNDRYDLKFSNSEIAWQTKEKGATTISALLVKIS